MGSLSLISGTEICLCPHHGFLPAGLSVLQEKLRPVVCVNLFSFFSFKQTLCNTKTAPDVVSPNTRGLVFGSGISDVFSFISFISFPKTGVSSDGIN
jgi:hypothetical protein